MRINKESRYAHWRGIMERFSKSGLPQEKFCKENKISFRRFKYYRYRIQLEDKKQTISPPFAKLQVNQAAVTHKSHSSFQIKLPNGLVLMINGAFDNQELAQLIKVLKQC